MPSGHARAPKAGEHYRSRARIWRSRTLVGGGARLSTMRAQGAVQKANPEPGGARRLRALVGLGRRRRPWADRSRCRPLGGGSGEDRMLGEGGSGGGAALASLPPPGAVYRRRPAASPVMAVTMPAAANQSLVRQPRRSRRRQKAATVATMTPVPITMPCIAKHTSSPGRVSIWSVRALSPASGRSAPEVDPGDGS